MAKLERKHIKVFAENAQTADIGQFGSGVIGAKVQTGDIEQIQALDAWQNGWGDGAISNNRYPALQERNGIDKVFSYELAYLFQNGLAEWNADTTYYLGSFVRQANTSNVYVSLTNDNTGNLLTDSNNWLKIPLGYKINYGAASVEYVYGTEYSAPNDGVLIVGCNFGIGVDPNVGNSYLTVRCTIDERPVFNNKQELLIANLTTSVNTRYDNYGVFPIAKGQKFKMFTFESAGTFAILSYILWFIPIVR